MIFCHISDDFKYKFSVKTTEECQTDSECRDPERCVRGSCVEACRIDPCGLNALCQSSRHQSVCTCPRGYIGNPHIECNPGNFYKLD